MGRVNIRPTVHAVWQDICVGIWHNYALTERTRMCEVSQVLFRLSRWENLEYAKKI